MKRLLAILLLPLACFADDYVLATSLPHNIVQPDYSLPWDDYTNSTVWLTGRMHGNQLVDFSPARSNVTIVGNPCLTFSGEESITVPISARIKATSFTVKADVKYNGFVGTAANTIYVQGYDRWASNTDYYLYIGNDSRVVFGVSEDYASSAFSTVSSPTALSTGVWHTIVCTYDADSNAGRLIVDGTDVGGFVREWTTADAQYINIGSKGGQPSSYNFNGVIAGLSVYDRVLSSNEIAQVTHPDGAVVSYPFSGGSGAVIHDVSGNGRNGALTTGAGGTPAAWANTQSNSPYFAQYGGSKVLSFKGVDSYGTASSTNWSLTEGSMTACVFVDPSLSARGQIMGQGDYDFLQNTMALAYSPGSFGFRIINSAGAGKAVTISASAGQWKTISATWSLSTGKLTITDGVTTNALAGLVASDFPSEKSALYIGKASTGSYRQFKGLVRSLVWADCFAGSSSVAYGNTLPDSAGTNNATLYNTSFVYIPALADGSNDAAGLGVTNPGGLVHNNGPHSLLIGGVGYSYANLLTNALFTVSTNSNGFITGAYQ